MSTSWQEGTDYFVLRRESGSERHDLPVFGARPGAVAIAPSPALTATKEDIDPGNGIFVLHNLLSAEECRQIVELSTVMGYTEDAPVSLGRDIRHNANNVWIADDETLNRPIFHRAKPLLPCDIQLRARDGSVFELGSPTGLNARWRLYRYDAPADEFKRHTDGAWPPTGLDSERRVIEDTSRGKQLSWLTFLIYLNDDFEGGGTRFFLESSQGLVVQPTRGSVLCFYHGYHPLSPLHAGELVTKGSKYVLRTDVEYQLP